MYSMWMLADILIKCLYIRKYCKLIHLLSLSLYAVSEYRRWFLCISAHIGWDASAKLQSWQQSSNEQVLNRLEYRYSPNTIHRKSSTGKSHAVYSKVHKNVVSERYQHSIYFQENIFVLVNSYMIRFHWLPKYDLLKSVTRADSAFMQVIIVSVF